MDDLRLAQRRPVPSTTELVGPPCDGCTESGPCHECAASEQAVTTATLTAAGCLAGLVDAVQTLSALAS